MSQMSSNPKNLYIPSLNGLEIRFDNLACILKESAEKT